MSCNSNLYGISHNAKKLFEVIYKTAQQQKYFLGSLLDYEPIALVDYQKIIFKLNSTYLTRFDVYMIEFREKEVNGCTWTYCASHRTSVL